MVNSMLLTLRLLGSWIIAVALSTPGTSSSRRSPIGWLVAVNRAYHRLESTERSNWRLSQNEFGTAEAGLLSCAASIMATQARNIQLFREKESLLTKIVRAL